MALVSRHLASGLRQRLVGVGQHLTSSKVWGAGSGHPILSHFPSHRPLLLLLPLLLLVAQPIQPQYHLLLPPSGGHTCGYCGDASCGRAGCDVLGVVLGPSWTWARGWDWAPDT